jgi:predicted nucleotidyltransferase component of viral defense system
MAAERYLAQVQLILRVIPEIAREEIFALKGGTAINLFLRDLPRLSVDIDLVYLVAHCSGHYDLDQMLVT